MRRAATRFRATGLLVVLSFSGCAAGPEGLRPTPPLLVPVLRIPGEIPKGELGFRFGPPRDVDGDRVSDIAAGARFADFESTQMGCAMVW